MNTEYTVRLNISPSHLWILVSRLISITFLLVFRTQPKHLGRLWCDNRNVLNKGDDEVRWWLSMGRPKVIIMVPIWKCVDLTPIGPIFLMLIIFIHIFFNYLLLFYSFSDHLLIEELTVTVPTGTKSFIQRPPSHGGIDSDSTNWNQIIHSATTFS